MKETIIKIENPKQYPEAAQKFIKAMGDNRIFAFYGNMGAGKTTFIRHICEALGVKDIINSPTFAIVNEYEDGEGNVIYHFDFYRIKNIAEIYNMGYEEYLYSDARCFIEWPELMEELLPEEVVNVYIEETDNGQRQIKIEYNNK